MDKMITSNKQLLQTLNPSVLQLVTNSNFDTGALRPFVYDGRAHVTITNAEGKDETFPVQNTAATLRLDEWKEIDRALIRVARPRLKLVGDLRGAGLVHTVASGMGKTVFESENLGDVGEASIGMDAITKSENDRPNYDLVGLPLPIVFKDFHFSARQIATSRNVGDSIDISTAESAGRKVAEYLEKMAIGTATDYKYAGYSVQGLVSYDNRITRTITSPAASGWTPVTTYNEVNSMIQDSIDAYYYGPWMLYCSTAWSQYLNRDYSSNYPNKTLGMRIKEAEGVTDMRILDYLEDYDMVLVQMTSDVVRLINGMDMTTVQWDTQGGLQQNFKVMSIMVPQTRADQNDNTGIVHGSV